MDFSNFSEADWQNFSYSVILIIFLLSGLLTRRDISAAKILKYLALWSLIAAILVMIYSYRYEFSDLKNRFLREINPASAKLNQSNQIIVNASQDGHFYLNSKVNGVEVRFMVDTGASDIAISMKDAKKIGLNIENLKFNKRYQTANGVAFGASITLKEIEIDEIKFSDLQASVNGGEMNNSLLGMSFLKQLKKYEFYQDQLILTISSN